MALRNILIIGDGVLQKRAKEVTEFDARLAQLLDDMAETMRKADGVGLAAPQVGILKRVFIIDAGEGLTEFVNPKILKATGSVTSREGCLSIPGENRDIARPKTVKVEAQDRLGKKFTAKGSDLFARAVCHELDHLDGILFIERAEE